MTMTKAKNLPQKQPLSIRLTTETAARGTAKAVCIPRAPKNGEAMLRVRRPTVGPQQTGLLYAAGDLICSTGGNEEIEARWLSADVRRLAWECWGESENQSMPLLADALVDAGCADERILDSLRNKRSEGWVSKILNAIPQAWVVVAAKPGFAHSSDHHKHYEQFVVARIATDRDHDAVAAQKADQEAADRQQMVAWSLR